MTRNTTLLANLSAVVLFAAAGAANAVTCANGVYRAGCAGPNGAAVVHKPPPTKSVTCANGAYHAGCVGPNGAATYNKSTGTVHGATTTQCRYVNGQRICN